MKTIKMLFGIVLSVLLLSSSSLAQRLVVFSIDDSKHGMVRYTLSPLKDNKFDLNLSVVWTSHELKPIVDRVSVVGFEPKNLKISSPLVKMVSPELKDGILAFNDNLTLKFEVNEQFSGGDITFDFPFFYAHSMASAVRTDGRVDFTFARPRNYVATTAVQASQLVDKTPPMVTILSPEGVSDGLKPIVESDKVRVKLSVNDFFGVQNVTVNNLPAQHLGDSTYVVDLMLRYGFEQEIKVVAQDINGLKREETFRIESRRPTQVAEVTTPQRRTNQPTQMTVNEPVRKEIEPSDVALDIPVVGVRNPNRYALIIGNEDYSSFQRGLQTESDVEFAINDAETFKKYALNVLGIPEENIILRINATAIEMDRAITQISSIARVKDGKAEIFVMYAGHGFPDEKTQEPYLIPVDVSGSDLKWAIKLTDFYARLTEHPTQRITVFLDACFSGGGREQGLLAARAVRVRPKENQLSGNLVVFAAASGDQTALPYKEKSHGMFTYHVLKMLQETKGNISYGEMSDYLKTTVGTRSIIVNQRDQNPQTNISPSLDDSWKEWRLR
jgi:hypothetical protein